MKPKKHQLVLSKGGQKYIFRYERGSEDKLLEALTEQARDPVSDFDWFDAAVLSFKLMESLITEAEELLGDNAERQIYIC